MKCEATFIYNREDKKVTIEYGNYEQRMQKKLAMTEEMFNEFHKLLDDKKKDEDEKSRNEKIDEIYKKLIDKKDDTQLS